MWFQKRGPDQCPESPQGLKPSVNARVGGTTEVVPFQSVCFLTALFGIDVTAAVKVYCGITSEPQRLKPLVFGSLNGTTEVVPFQNCVLAKNAS